MWTNDSANCTLLQLRQGPRLARTEEIRLQCSGTGSTRAHVFVLLDPAFANCQVRSVTAVRPSSDFAGSTESSVSAWVW